MRVNGPPDDTDIDLLATRKGYDRWARIYDDEDNALIALEEPHVAALLGEPHGLSIVDVGCGTGRHAVRWARAGARVTALDFSHGMLARARTKPEAEAVRFVEHDLARSLPLRNHTFDRVTCCLVLDHIAALAPLFAELGRVCRPDGFIVISVMHPALMLRGIQARFTDPETGRDTRPASVPNQISDYVGAAVAAGLALDHISEHVVDESLAARSPRARKYLGWPMLFMMRLRPTSG